MNTSLAQQRLAPKLMGGKTEGEEERFVQKERVTGEGNLALRSVVGDREIGIGELTGHGLRLSFLDGKAQHQTFSGH